MASKYCNYVPPRKKRVKKRLKEKKTCNFDRNTIKQTNGKERKKRQKKKLFIKSLVIEGIRRRFST